MMLSVGSTFGERPAVISVSTLSEGRRPDLDRAAGRAFDACDLPEGDDPIRLVLADIAGRPFRRLQLDDGLNEPLGLLRQMFGHLLAGREFDRPFDLGRGVDEDHRDRSERSRWSVEEDPRARPFGAPRFGIGTRRTPVPFGMKAKLCPASRFRAVRVAFGIHIWNFEDRGAVSTVITTLGRSMETSQDGLGAKSRIPTKGGKARWHWRPPRRGLRSAGPRRDGWRPDGNRSGAMHASTRHAGHGELQPCPCHFQHPRTRPEGLATDEISGGRQTGPARKETVASRRGPFPTPAVGFSRNGSA